MSVLLAPDGITHARQTLIDLAVSQVLWFLSGERFLKALPSLASVRAAVQCRRCGQPPRVVELNDRKFSFRCCAHGVIDGAKATELAPLLPAVGWELVCAVCHDPLVGDNDPQGATYTVTCPCTKRIYLGKTSGLVS